MANSDSISDSLPEGASDATSSFDELVAASLRTADEAGGPDAQLPTDSGHAEYIADLASQLRADSSALVAHRDKLLQGMADQDGEARAIVSAALIAAFDMGTVAAVLAAEMDGVFADALERKALRENHVRGQIRAAKSRADKWRPDALDIAKEVLAGRPSESDAGVCRAVVRRMDGRGYDLPDARQITAVISDWRRAGELPGRAPTKKA